MPLKTLVKVSNITNLSDARYCAGMGVDMLGFSVVSGNPHHISEAVFQQIRGWISGPKVVAELYGASIDFDLKSMIENYSPDYLESDLQTYRSLSAATKLPFIVYLSSKELNTVTESYSNVAYWIVDHNETIMSAGIPILVKLTSAEGLAYANDYAGVVLSGSPEIRPGFKNYDELADILEALDEV
jgi:phosphoribosylanthranilate isomerase